MAVHDGLPGKVPGVDADVEAADGPVLRGDFGSLGIDPLLEARGARS